MSNSNGELITPLLPIGIFMNVDMALIICQNEYHCSLVPQKSDWGFDEKKKVQYRRVEQYMSDSVVSINMHPGIKDSEKTFSFHRSLQTFSEALSKSGFCIAGLEEWVSNKKSQEGPRQRAEDTARKEIPLFMMITARKS